MSRKKNREHRRQMALLRSANNREEHIANTVVEVQYKESMSQFDALPFDEKTDDDQLYVEVAHVIERQISIKRVAA